MNRRTLLAAGSLALLAGCASPDINLHAGDKPVLDLRTYFNGMVDGHGLVTNRAGRVLQRFSVVMDCRWEGDQGVLDEFFTYADGRTQRRVWRVRKLADGRYTGQAGDVIGEAIGQARGNALHWRYTLAVPVDGRTWHLDLDDWMYLMNERVLLNRTSMNKFGVRVGDITMSFYKR